jgi:hypothetical protein
LDINLAEDLSILLYALLLAGFKENHSVLWFLKSLQKIRETIKLESIHEKHFPERKSEGRQPDKNLSLSLYPETLTKMPFKNSISG